MVSSNFEFDQRRVIRWFSKSRFYAKAILVIELYGNLPLVTQLSLEVNIWKT